MKTSTKIEIGIALLVSALIFMLFITWLVSLTPNPCKDLPLNKITSEQRLECLDE